MALTTKTISDTGSRSHHKFTLTVNENQTSISDNTSSLSFTFKISPVQTGWNWSGWGSSISYTININDTKYTGSIASYNGSSTVTLKSDSLIVKHDTNGSKTINISFSVTDNAAQSYTPGNASKSGTLELTKIPRASTLSLSKTSVAVGSSITANITRADTSFKHTVEFYINSTYSQTYKNIDTSQQFTIPTSWYNYMSSSVQCTATCCIITYDSGGNQVGTKVTKTFTVTVPSTIVPTMGTVTLAPSKMTNDINVDSNNNVLLVKGKNSLTITASNCKAGTGSSIASYTFAGPSLPKTTTDKSSITIPSVSSYGEALTYTVTVTDARGRTTSTSAEIRCYNYYAPSLSAFDAYRADVNGNPKNDGTYLKWTYTAKKASVGNTNTITVKLIDEGGAFTSTTNSLINLNGDSTSTYRVYATIQDSYGGSSSSSAINVFGSSRILNILPDGTGVAIGKMAKEDKNGNLFECAWDAEFNGNVSLDRALSIENGGTNATTASEALANLGGLEIVNATSTSDDMNTYLTQGAHIKLYRTNSNTLNTPYKTSKTGFNSALILSYATSKPSGADSGYGKQIAFSSGGHIWEREMNAGVISDWDRMGDETRTKEIVSTTVTPEFTVITNNTNYSTSLSSNQSRVFTATNQVFITARFALTVKAGKTINAGTDITLGKLKNYPPMIQYCPVVVYQNSSQRRWIGYISSDGSIIVESDNDVTASSDANSTFNISISTSYVTE